MVKCGQKNKINALVSPGGGAKGPGALYFLSRLSLKKFLGQDLLKCDQK